MKNITLLITFALLGAACTQAETKVEAKAEAMAERTMEMSAAKEMSPIKEMSQWRVDYVDAKGAAEFLDQNPAAIVLDVRTPKEYAAGHIAKAVNINFYDDDFKAQLAGLDKSKTYLLHCKSGGRSTKALALMKDLGFSQVTHLDGGFDAWKKASLPVAG